MTTRPPEAKHGAVENLRAAVATVRDRWNRRLTLLLVAALATALLPFIVQNDKTLRGLAWVWLFALAGVGLNIVLGLGNMASIGHGAFVAIGAVAAANLRTRTSWSFIAIVAAATLLAAAAGWIVAKGAIRLGAVQLAVSTWLFAWLVTLSFQAFPELSGGAGGIALGPAPIGSDLVGFTMRATPSFFYWVALACLIVALLLFRSLERSSVGLALSTIKQNAKEARTIGTFQDGLRLSVMVLGATLAGLAGALGVQLSGVFDQQLFGILLSISLFIAVTIGGPGRVFAPLVGAVVIAVLPLPGQPLVPYFSIFEGSWGQVLAGLLLLLILWLRSGDRTTRAATVTPPVVDGPSDDLEPVVAAPTLRVAAVTKRFGGLVALDRVDVEAHGGQIHGIMGPNGSGKSTLLAIVSGHLSPDEGTVMLGDLNVTVLTSRERLRAGISRSLQSTEYFPSLSVVDHLVAARLVDRRHGGIARSALQTPLARAEDDDSRRAALQTLTGLDLHDVAERPVGEVAGGRRRLLTIAMAVTNRSVVLLDEPSAGLSADEIRQVVEILSDCKQKGIALIVVEHNLRLLRRVADVVTVLEGGRVIAHGPPEHVFEDQLVRRAYLGSMDEGVSG